ncbi:Follistatin-related protein 4 [Labeo rohita]|uniref:Follistatin-related protein 4 n=1 Tax=Labeo rohita TaxID=84645 RepID=A0ABQ8LMS5_LABRO|nr:Follistatin-related protein 4 [Labeo rohita]
MQIANTHPCINANGLLAAFGHIRLIKFLWCGFTGDTCTMAEYNKLKSMLLDMQPRTSTDGQANAMDQRRTLVDTMFKYIDRNQDGRLSSEELAEVRRLRVGVIKHCVGQALLKVKRVAAVGFWRMSSGMREEGSLLKLTDSAVLKVSTSLCLSCLTDLSSMAHSGRWTQAAAVITDVVMSCPASIVARCEEPAVIQNKISHASCNACHNVNHPEESEPPQSL